MRREAWAKLAFSSWVSLVAYLAASFQRMEDLFDGSFFGGVLSPSDSCLSSLISGIFGTDLRRFEDDNCLISPILKISPELPLLPKPGSNFLLPFLLGKMLDSLLNYFVKCFLLNCKPCKFFNCFSVAFVGAIL